MNTGQSDAELEQQADSVQKCEAIRELAYSKWESAGCPCGDGVEFWLQAEAEVTVADTASPCSDGDD